MDNEEGRKGGGIDERDLPRVWVACFAVYYLLGFHATFSGLQLALTRPLVWATHRRHPIGARS